MTFDRVAKVQRPLATTGAAPADWLVYAKGRKCIQSMPAGHVPASVVEAMGKDAKAYFRGAYDRVAGWTLGERVPNEGW